MLNLLNARKAIHKTQQEVADYLGISRQAYSNYEAGKREPDFETLLKLGEYFGCSVDYLLGNKKDPAPKGEVSDEDIKFALFDGAPPAPSMVIKSLNASTVIVAFSIER